MSPVVWCAQVRGEVFVDNPDQRIQDDVRAFATTSVRQPVHHNAGRGLQASDHKGGACRFEREACLPDGQTCVRPKPNRVDLCD